MAAITTTYLRARKWPLLIIYLLIAFPFILVKLLSSYGDPNNVFYIVFIFFAHALIFVFWYSLEKLEIRIYEQSIAYKTFLYIKEVNWDDIIDVDIHFGFAGQHPHVKWTFYAGEKSIVIDPSYFSKTDNRFLAEVIVAKCSNARISKSINNMANGKFPWYLF
ncbi:MAG TPA: hypothetical protein VFW07_11305 [Parafilimonas sp.]|nr:hypothetical protein [Parafilimonas sp.]